jgi:hypothetical protein
MATSKIAPPMKERLVSVDAGVARGVSPGSRSGALVMMQVWSRIHVLCHGAEGEHVQLLYSSPRPVPPTQIRPWTFWSAAITPMPPNGWASPLKRVQVAPRMAGRSDIALYPVY